MLIHTAKQTEDALKNANLQYEDLFFSSKKQNVLPILKSNYMVLIENNKESVELDPEMQKLLEQQMVYQSSITVKIIDLKTSRILFILNVLKGADILKEQYYLNKRPIDLSVVIDSFKSSLKKTLKDS